MRSSLKLLSCLAVLTLATGLPALAKSDKDADKSRRGGRQEEGRRQEEKGQGEGQEEERRQGPGHRGRGRQRAEAQSAARPRIIPPPA